MEAKREGGALGGQGNHQARFSCTCLWDVLLSTPELRAGISYNTVDGAVDRRSFHGAYEVQDGLPL